MKMVIEFASIKLGWFSEACSTRKTLVVVLYLEPQFTHLRNRAVTPACCLVGLFSKL